MRAARYFDRGDIRIQDIAEPEVQPGTVGIDVAWCGICGTDLHEYLEGPIFVPAAGHPHPVSGESAPITLGHEMSGTVYAVGEGVDDLAIGDSVVVEPYIIDPKESTEPGSNYHLTPNMNFIGLAGRGGGLGEKIVVERRWAHPVGDIPLDEAALIEPLSVGYHAFVRSGAQSGDIALIGGAGPIGLLTAAILKAHGLTVIISEPSSLRRQKAIDTGVADHALDPMAVDVVRRGPPAQRRGRRRCRVRVQLGERRAGHAVRRDPTGRGDRGHRHLGSPRSARPPEAGTQGDRPAGHHRLHGQPS